MGRNGAGKSSLLWALQGSGARAGGRVDVADREGMHAIPPTSMRPKPDDSSVSCRTRLPTCSTSTRSPKSSRAPTPSRTRHLDTRATTLDRIAPGVPADAHPRDLSEGQRLALVLAVQLAAAPKVVLLDEPTRGLDYHAKRELGVILRELAAPGTRSRCRPTTSSSSPRPRTASW